MTIEDLENQINEIKERNKRVEIDKAWESSWCRRIVILVLTYLIVLSFFVLIKSERPYINAIVPTIGFGLSTLTIPVLKKIWIKIFSR